MVMWTGQTSRKNPLYQVHSARLSWQAKGNCETRAGDNRSEEGDNPGDQHEVKTPVVFHLTLATPPLG